MRQFGILTVLLLMTNLGFAKEGFIVRLDEKTSPMLFEKFNNVQLKTISKDLKLYLATPTGETSVTKALLQAKQSPSVKYANANHKVAPRTTITKLLPNDKDFGRHWSYNLDETNFGIDATMAWAVHGTGGMDKNGGEIVIAVVDGGFDITHPDLVNNLWVNKGEIPGNGIDDDGNGYIDDINGWDAEDETGNIQVDYHGTHVAGTMGAEGDNGINGSGVNWKVKIMFVSAGWGLADTDTTLAAYEYIRKQKEIWLQTGGKAGANVVAINSSFGIDQADCNTTEYSQWNDMFNLLGQSGILSVAATANSNWDIDVVGDVPTGCSSDFVVAVTNSMSNGEKETWAGYGIKTIDIAAPGTDIYSTYPGKGFAASSGTSMATPHVTGAIGYLYSVASKDFLTHAALEPARAALDMKDYLLLTVTERESMKGKNVSGGILNLFKASNELAAYSAQNSGRELVLACTK